MGLDSEDEVFAPKDDDDVIRLKAQPSTHPELRFAVGERVECNLGDHWALGTIASLNYYREGRTVPYRVQLDSGNEVFAPKDDDNLIRLVSVAELPGGGSLGSKISQKRVGQQASSVGTKYSGSKLGSSK